MCLYSPFYICSDYSHLFTWAWSITPELSTFPSGSKAWSTWRQDKIPEQTDISKARNRTCLRSQPGARSCSHLRVVEGTQFRHDPRRVVSIPRCLRIATALSCPMHASKCCHVLWGLCLVAKHHRIHVHPQLDSQTVCEIIHMLGLQPGPKFVGSTRCLPRLVRVTGQDMSWTEWP